MNSPPTAKHQRQILFFESPPINYELNVSRSSIETGPSTHLHERELQLAEQKFMKKIDHFPIPKSEAEGLEPWEQNEFNRLSINYKYAKDAVIEGSAMKEKDNRRTGESYYIHPLRIFLRGIASMSTVRPKERSVFHVSLLARLFHDAKEDLTQFTIQPYNKEKRESEITKYAVRFKNKPDPSFLYLTPREKRLLDLQLEALTIPPEVEGIKNKTEKTQKQIAHLLHYVDKIYHSPDGGAYAAYQTLQIKLEDRLDNLLTYYDSKNNKTNKKNTKENLFDKCRETIQFFRAVEKQAEVYHSEAGGEDYIQVQKSKYESVVRLCYYILLGASYDDIVQYGDTTEINIANGTKFTIPFRRDAVVDKNLATVQKADWTHSYV